MKTPIRVLYILMGAIALLHADIVFLNNGGTIEGMVVSRDSIRVRVDMGYGITEIENAEIRSVEMAAGKSRNGLQQQWGSEFIGQDRFVPPRLKLCNDSLRELAAVRSPAIQWSRESRRYLHRVRELEDTIATVEAEYVSINDTIRSNTDLNSYHYNSLIKRLNMLAADLTVRQHALTGLQQQAPSANPHLKRYIVAIDEFKHYLFAKRGAMARKGVSSAEQEYFTLVAEKVAEFEKDFETTALAVSRQNNVIVVTAKVNGKVHGRFIFDTGATIMTISLEFAKRLGLDLAALDRCDVVLADGKKVPAKNITLASVMAENAEVREVRAVILDQPPAPGVDGLLGMSFLGEFTISFDGKSGVVFLKRFVR
jgi:clan AA aspartic protease (TIGR02281 family)